MEEKVYVRSRSHDKYESYTKEKLDEMIKPEFIEATLFDSDGSRVTTIEEEQEYSLSKTLSDDYTNFDIGVRCHQTGETYTCRSIISSSEISCQFNRLLKREGLGTTMLITSIIFKITDGGNKLKVKKCAQTIIEGSSIQVGEIAYELMLLGLDCYKN